MWHCIGICFHLILIWLVDKTKFIKFLNTQQNYFLAIARCFKRKCDLGKNKEAKWLFFFDKKQNGLFDLLTCPSLNYNPIWHSFIHLLREHCRPGHESKMITCPKKFPNFFYISFQLQVCGMFSCWKVCCMFSLWSVWKPFYLSVSKSNKKVLEFFYKQLNALEFFHHRRSIFLFPRKIN